jgi:RND superfamily putative drug exporter
MVGIGVGIDYALFIVTRYREALRRTGDPFAATMEAIDTAGRAVVFAGVTVMISLLGMLLMGLSFLNGLALGTSSAVMVAVLAASRCCRPAGVRRPSARRLSIHRRAERTGETGWHRWSRSRAAPPRRLRGRRARAAARAGARRRWRCGSGERPTSATMPSAPPPQPRTTGSGRRFGPGENGPLLVVPRRSDPATRPRPNCASRRRRLPSPGVAAIDRGVTRRAGRRGRP